MNNERTMAEEFLSNHGTNAIYAPLATSESQSYEGEQFPTGLGFYTRQGYVGFDF